MEMWLDDWAWCEIREPVVVSILYQIKLGKLGEITKAIYAMGATNVNLIKLLGYFSLPYTEISKLVMLAWVKWQFNCSSNLNVLEYLKV